MHDDGPQTTPDDDHAPGDLRRLANDGGLSRREFVAGAGTVGIGLIASEWLDPLSRAGDTETMTDSRDTFSADPLMPLSLSINGKQQTLQIDPRATLLDTLREGLHLFGTKKGCNHGQCGACTVLVNGRRVNSCLALALQHEGDAVITIEGLANGDDLHPVQAAFIKHDGFQCGYCTPGQICSAVACLQEGHTRDDAEIREWMSGNICRCGAYPNIVAAIKEVRDQRAS